MIQIYYGPTVLVISLIWITVRACFAARQKQINWKRELQLLLGYICIIVVVRLTFFPIRITRTSFKPPAVEPAQEPMNISSTISA